MRVLFLYKFVSRLLTKTNISMTPQKLNYMCKIGWLVAISIGLLFMALTSCNPPAKQVETIVVEKIKSEKSEPAKNRGSLKFDELSSVDRDYLVSGMHYHFFGAGDGQIRNITLDSLMFEEYKRQETYRNSGNVYAH